MGSAESSPRARFGKLMRATRSPITCRCTCRRPCQRRSWRRPCPPQVIGGVDMAQGELSGKRGKPFERVVKEVLSTLDPRSVVRQGQWVTGPDGRRELDVLIEGSVEGVRRRVLVECKDFNPNTTGPVGIRFVDALESKRRDLAADVSFICSNAGFTTDAIRKAKRVGIGLIAVLRERDH